ncbi:MAG: ATPase, T2SS/T4P/T4SS family [Patescibacteria group bacterium]|jgi:twitching motility protein PilT
MDTTDQLLLNKLLAAVAEYKASDLHLVAGNYPILRVDGKLFPLNNEVLLNVNFLKNIVDSWLTPEQQKALDVKKEIVFTYTTSNKMRFKVSVYFQKGVLSVSLKLIPSHIKNLSELGLPPYAQQIAALKKGLILIAGTFGAGKSSTLAGIVETINQNETKHIITIENPIEYLFVDNRSIIEQRELGRDTPTILEALKFIGEEDVDVVVLSELAGKEMIEQAFKVVDSGRLVIAAVNAESTIKVLENIINEFPVAEHNFVQNKLADTLCGVMVQRMLPSLSGTAAVACELFFPENDQSARAIIASGEVNKMPNVLYNSTKQNMVAFDRSLAELMHKGEISMAVALENAHDREFLQTIINRYQ